MIGSLDWTAGRGAATMVGKEREPNMYATKNDLSAETRVAVVKILNERLADAIVLQTQCKQAHWNVKGPAFIALHELFDKVNEAVEEYIDELAERAVQLGGIAEGTAQAVVGRTTLPAYSLTLRTGPEHVTALADVLARFGKTTRAAINSTDELGDKVTSDLFTEVTSGIDKWLWFVESHLQAER
jgi:starvation-inducible DNA-binding protein